MEGAPDGAYYILLLADCESDRIWIKAVTMGSWREAGVVGARKMGGRRHVAKTVGFQNGAFGEPRD